MATAPFTSDSIVISAEPRQIFDILADPRRHSEIDGSGTVRDTLFGPDRLSKGATFGMSMRMGVSYKITNKVIAFDPDTEIAWRHFGGHIWRYRLEPIDAQRTRVVESWDCSPMKPTAQLAVRLVGFPRRTRRNITATLVRLKVLAEPTPR